MKLKLSQLLDMKVVVEKLIGQDVPVTVGYDLMKLVKAFDAELDLYSKARTKLFDKYGEEDKEKKTKSVPEAKVEAFRTDMQKLLDKEVKLEIGRIKLSQLGNTVKLSTADLIKIELLIEK